MVDEARECVVQMIDYARKNNRQVVGLGQSVLAGVLELIRGANYGVQQGAKNSETLADDVRKFLAATKFEETMKPAEEKKES